MNVLADSKPHWVSSRAAAWGAVLAMTLCVSALIASEFMPVSLLTPIASDLHLTEGQAGQAISISGVFAVLTSLLVSGLTRRIDRRSVLLGLTLLMVASGAIVALADVTAKSRCRSPWRRSAHAIGPRRSTRPTSSATPRSSTRSLATTAPRSHEVILNRG